MRLRSAVSLSTLFLLAGLSGCAEDGYDPTDNSQALVVDPLYFAANEELTGFDPVNFTAMVDGAPVAATWVSEDPAVATIHPTTGVVTPLSSGFTAISATFGGKTKSASLTVNAIPGVSITSGQVISGIGGVPGDLLLYRILVPAGTTNLNATLSGGTGDFDLYVRADDPPTFADWDCRPYLGGNNEVCNIPNPTAGILYFIWLDVYTAGSGTQLVVTLTP